MEAGNQRQGEGSPRRQDAEAGAADSERRASRCRQDAEEAGPSRCGSPERPGSGLRASACPARQHGPAGPERGRGLEGPAERPQPGFPAFRGAGHALASPQAPPARRCVGAAFGVLRGLPLCGTEATAIATETLFASFNQKTVTFCFLLQFYFSYVTKILILLFFLLYVTFMIKD